MSKRIAVAAAAVLAAGAGATGVVASSDDGEGGVTGPAAERARAAALAAVPGRAGTVERDGEDGATWEVEITRRDGGQVDVRLDARLRPVVVERDGEDAEARTAITHPYLPLSAFRRCVLAGTEAGTPVRVVRTRLDRTEPFTVDGDPVAATVIEDRNYEDGALVERTLDFFAQADDGRVLYLGEDVDDLAAGRIVGHHGSWRLGRDTTRPGVAMPARPRPGARWRYEDVPGVTIEDDELVSRTARLRVGRRTYHDVLRVRESLRRERQVEYKLYARGVGVVRELPPGGGRVDLVACRR